MSYLARKYKLDGGCEDNRIRVDLATSIILDALIPQITLCHNPEFVSIMRATRTPQITLCYNPEFVSIIMDALTP